MWYTTIFGNMPIGKASSRKLAKMATDIEFINNYQRLLNMSLNVFKWENLPETCNERFLELSLMTNGMAILANEKGNYLNLAFNGGSGVNVYGEFLNGFGYGLNGFNKEYALYIDGAETCKDVLRGSDKPHTASYNAVMCRDNITGYPYIDYIYMCALRLTRNQRAIDVVTQNLKQPMIITCEESMVKSVKETLNQRTDNVSAIISSGKLPIDSFKVWQTGADPTTLTTLQSNFEWIQNQFYDTMGVENNPESDKKERLLVDEINANNESTQMNVAHRLEQRKLFCERVNKAFGLNISVKVANEEISHGEKNEEISHGEKDEESEE